MVKPAKRIDVRRLDRALRIVSMLARKDSAAYSDVIGLTKSLLDERASTNHTDEYYEDLSYLSSRRRRFANPPIPAGLTKAQRMDRIKSRRDAAKYAFMRDYDSLRNNRPKRKLP